jgi:RND family efflux transporter MFP subunit
MKRALTHRTRYWVLAVLPLAAATHGCKAKATPESGTLAESAAVSVQTTDVVEADVPKVLHLTGTLRGDRETDLAANASGRVIATSVERGAQVAPGQVLARLDVRAAALSAAEARAQADSARAQQDQAERECERYEQLRGKNVISEQEYERVATQCRTSPLAARAASARAQLAAQNVGDGVIRAPFAGVITERYVEVGQYVRQDSRVVTVVAPDPLRLELAVPEADVSRIRENAEVRFRVAAHPGRSFSGSIRFVSGAVRAATRDLVVEALVPNTDRALKPGMFADVELAVGMKKLPVVPRQGVALRDGRAHAFFVIEGRLEERVLSLGSELGERVGVQDGARLGEQVVVGDLSKLKNGQRVR